MSEVNFGAFLLFSCNAGLSEAALRSYLFGRETTAQPFLLKGSHNENVSKSNIELGWSVNAAKIVIRRHRERRMGCARMEDKRWAVFRPQLRLISDLANH